MDTDVIRINDFYDGNGNIRGVISAIDFADGSTPIDLTTLEIPILGTEGDDILNGFGLSDTLIGLAGDDTLQGSSGFDTYVFGPGFGSDFLNESSTGADGGRILFEVGITPADLSIVRDLNNARDVLIMMDTDVIRINDFYDGNGNIRGVISAIDFADGSTPIDLTDLTGPAGDPDPVPQALEISLELGETLSPGETGTLEIVVTGIDPEAAEGATGPISYLVEVSANRGLVADTLSGGFSATSFVLVTIDPNAPPTDAEPLRIAVPYRGSGGPNSNVEITVSLANQSSATNFVNRVLSSTPDFFSDGNTARLGANVEAFFGDTIESLAAALADFATRFNSFNLNADSATSALSFALEAAGDFGTLETRSYEGSYGQGYVSLADIGLEIDSGSVRLAGLSDISALQALSLSGSAVYAVSNSVDRSVSLTGGTLGVAAPTMPRFEQQIDGQYSTVGSFEGTLSQTDAGYRIDLPDGSVYLFDPDGVFISLELSTGQAVTPTYDAETRIIGLTGPNGGSLNFERDATGLVTSVTDENGQNLDLTYNTDGQLASASLPSGLATFDYDANGDLVEAIAPGNIVSAFTYDDLGRLLTANYGGGLACTPFVRRTLLVCTPHAARLHAARLYAALLHH
jgi:YD repeat-containing protein